MTHGPKREKIKGFRKLYNKELYDTYFSRSIICVFKARRMGWEGHVARIGENKNAYTILVADPEGRRPLE
jgi:hypothetical protein